MPLPYLEVLPLPPPIPKKFIRPSLASPIVSAALPALSLSQSAPCLALSAILETPERTASYALLAPCLNPSHNSKPLFLAHSKLLPTKSLNWFALSTTFSTTFLAPVLALLTKLLRVSLALSTFSLKEEDFSSFPLGFCLLNSSNSFLPKPNAGPIYSIPISSTKSSGMITPKIGIAAHIAVTTPDTIFIPVLAVPSESLSISSALL